ncbi:hypothetical protein D3C81_2206350 [compost metagenome]
MVKKNRKVQPWIPQAQGESAWKAQAASQEKTDEEQEQAQTASTRQEVQKTDAEQADRPLEPDWSAE